MHVSTTGEMVSLVWYLPCKMSMMSKSNDFHWEKKRGKMAPSVKGSWYKKKKQCLQWPPFFHRDTILIPSGNQFGIWCHLGSKRHFFTLSQKWPHLHREVHYESPFVSSGYHMPCEDCVFYWPCPFVRQKMNFILNLIKAPNWGRLLCLGPQVVALIIFFIRTLWLVCCLKSVYLYYRHFRISDGNPVGGLNIDSL